MYYIEEDDYQHMEDQLYDAYKDGVNFSEDEYYGELVADSLENAWEEISLTD